MKLQFVRSHSILSRSSSSRKRIQLTDLDSPVYRGQSYTLKPRTCNLNLWVSIAQKSNYPLLHSCQAKTSRS